MPTKRPRLTHDQWAAHVKQQVGSELSVLAYCKQHNLSDKTFSKWKFKLRDHPQRASRSRAGFTPVGIQSAQEKITQTPTVTLSLGNGMVLSIIGSGQSA